MSDFGALLHAHRTTAHLSQSALAEAAGLDQTYIGLLERGRRGQPSRPTVLALADALTLTTSQSDRLLHAAGHASVTDYQALWEREHGELDARTKWCPGCLANLPTWRFSADRSRLRGLSNYCRSCRSAKWQAWFKRVTLRGVRRAS